MDKVTIKIRGASQKNRIHTISCINCLSVLEYTLRLIKPVEDNDQLVSLKCPVCCIGILITKQSLGIEDLNLNEDATEEDSEQI